MLKELELNDNAAWKQRFRTRKILRTQLARTEQTRGLVAADLTGVCQLYAWALPAQLTQLTQKPEGILFARLSDDGRYVYYLDDKQGNDLGHLVRVPFEGGEVQDLTQEMAPYPSNGWDWDVSQTCNVVALNVADSEGFHLYCIDQKTHAARLVYESKALACWPHVSHGGEIVVIASTERSGKPEYSLLAYDVGTCSKIGEAWDGPGTSIEFAVFSPRSNDFRVLTTTNRTGVNKPIIWNPRSGERVDLTFDELDGDVFPFDWSSDAERVIVCQVHSAIEQLYVYNLKTRIFQRLNHPSGTFGYFSPAGAYFAPNGEIFAEWQDSVNPAQLIALDGVTGELKRVVLCGDRPPSGHPWKSVTFPSSDGQIIQGWLGVPSDEGPFPTILHTHGGPDSVMTEAFSPESQAWLDHGFAFLTVNYRGSLTFGRDFQKKIWGNPGHWEIADMVAARDWLVKTGISNPNQILLTGRSYGGYLTLQALGMRPDLWAGGMAQVAIADWKLVWEDAAETLRGYDEALFTGSPNEKPEQYVASSPTSYAENVVAPVLIIQGRNDTRVPPRQIEVYVKKMKSLGKSIEIVWFDAGHMNSYLKVERAIAHQELMLRFAHRVLLRE